jgi:hypothetical protein
LRMPRIPEHIDHSSGDLAPLAGWERWAGHSGYVAEGVLYLLVGFFALLAATGQRQQPNGAQGSLAHLGSSMTGKILLVFLATGLGAFVIWQLVVAIWDPEHRATRTTSRRRLVRLGHLSNGIFHILFVAEAVWGLFGLSHAHNEKEGQVQWTARALAIPAGQYVIALIGVSIILYGIWQFYRAMTRDKNKRVDLPRGPLGLLIDILGIYGLAARGALFALVGGYLVNAAWHHDPRYSGGVAGALSGLKAQRYGEWLLGVTAAGLMCYGVYQVAKERYRRLQDS